MVWQTIAAICGGITLVSAAVTHIVKTIHGLTEATRKPWERVHSRIDELELTNREILSKIAELGVQQTSNDQITARLEILNLIQHQPENSVAINHAYDLYAAKGWNSYIHDTIKEWSAEQTK